MSTKVWQSAQIKAPIDKLWALIRPLDFKYLKSAVESVEIEGKAAAADVGSVRKVVYKDKTVQRLKLTSLSDAQHAVSWDLIESEPAISVLSVSHTVQLRRVSEDNSTFIEWTTDFSSDASSAVIEDARFKQQENFAALTKATIRKRKNWMPLESDPDLMNKYIYQLGVDRALWQFHEILGHDEELLLMVPQPVIAVLMLFPISDASSKHAKEEAEKIKKNGQTVGKDVYWMRQTVGNACGTIGLIHAILNCADKVPLEDNKFFAKFLKQTKGMTPEQRAQALEENTDLEVTHQAVASEGKSRVEAKVNENLHFISFVNVDGQLYELDGCKGGPINHGKTSTDTLLFDAVAVVRQFMARDPKELRFNLVALGPKPMGDYD